MHTRTYIHAYIHTTHPHTRAGKVLSRYLVSTGNFTHPVSRRPLTRAECVALDDYMTRLNLGEAAVTHAFDLKVCSCMCFFCACACVCLLVFVFVFVLVLVFVFVLVLVLVFVCCLVLVFVFVRVLALLCWLEVWVVT